MLHFWEAPVSTIHLLQDFDKKLFQASYETQLMGEDDRLESLNRITKEHQENQDFT